MVVGAKTLIKIWDQRIKSVEQKISDYQSIGIEANDPGMRELYCKLDYFRKRKEDTENGL